MKTKYYISTIEDSDVKAYCIMNDQGLVMACESRKNDEAFYAEVEKVSKYYNCEICKEKIQEKQPNTRIYAKIPNIKITIGDYLNTVEGSKVILEYFTKEEALNYHLIDELMQISRKKE